MANEDQMSWQRQNMKKTGAQTLSVGSMHPKLNCGCSPVAKYADGGEVDEATLKAEGLAASSGESTGFWKRLSQGNIDDPSSEAYHEYGAGRGQRERNAKAASDESAAIAKYERDAKATADVAIANATPTKKQDMGEFEGVDEAIERNKTTTASPASAPVKPKPVAAKPVAVSKADARDAETGNGRGSRSFSADVAERKAKASAPAASSDTSFDPVKLNFVSSKPAVKPMAQEDKNKARPISRSRAYYSGNT